MIQFEAVDIAYDGAVTVAGLDLTIETGTFFTLLGPSGCGKTTILRSLAGFVPLSKGRIRVDGTDITTLAAEARGIGIVFQNYALFPHLTVFDNVAFGLRAAGVASAEVAARVAEILEWTGIAAHARRMPAALSGGQQQRVAIARSLVMRPTILLMDEPLSNLDVKLRIAMRAEIKRLQRHFGFTTLYVTHDQEEALSLSDRIAVLDAGRIRQVGSPEDIYRRPDNAFVCQFIGEANALTPDLLAGMAGEPARQAFAGRDVFIRPEHIHILNAPDAICEYRCDAIIDDVTFLGLNTRYRLRLPTGMIDVIAANGAVSAAGHVACAPGDPVTIGFDTAALMSFPAGAVP